MRPATTANTVDAARQATRVLNGHGRPVIQMSGGKLSLDDYMHLLWVRHGKPGGPVPGIVAKPYTVKDLRDHLATLTSNRKFADDFFDKYIEGRDVPDFRRLLALAGYSLTMAPAGKGWLGNVTVTETGNGLAVGVPPRPSPVPFNTPLYDAGIDSGDTIKTIDGQSANQAAWNAIGNRKPGDQVTLGVMRRGGEMITKTVILKQDPNARQVVPMDNMSPAQKAFRDNWLASKVK